MESRRAFTPEEAAAIVDMYVEDELPMIQIAERMHCCRTTIGNYLRRAGVDTRGAGGGERPLCNIPHRQMEQIRWLYCEVGLSAREIGETLGIDITGVLYRMKRGGIPRRSRSEALKLAYRRGIRRPTDPYLVNGKFARRPEALQKAA